MGKLSNTEAELEKNVYQLRKEVKEIKNNFCKTCLILKTVLIEVFL